MKGTVPWLGRRGQMLAVSRGALGEIISFISLHIYPLYFGNVARGQKIKHPLLMGKPKFHGSL